MAQQNSFKILEVSHVAPLAAQSDSPDSATKQLTEFTLPLTFLDTFCFKFPPVQCLFFYSSDQHLMASTIVPKFKHSLSLTLHHYLPLAGTLTWPPNSPKPHILFEPGCAVSLTVAESTSGKFNHLSGNHVVREASESRPLVPALRVDDESASIMALQITLFPGEGFCVGVSAHHAFLDGKSVAMFMRSWAHVSKFDNGRPLPPDLTPFYDRTSIKDPTGQLDTLYLNRWLAKSTSALSKGKVFQHWSELSDAPSDLVRCTFELTRGEIDSLKTRALRADEALTPDDLTSFVVASAHVMTCMVKAASSEPESPGGGEDDRRLYFVVGADYRSRLSPPVPSNYFGNCAGSHVGQMPARDCLGGDGLAFAAAKIRSLVKGLDKGVLEGAEERLVKWGSLERGSHVIAITWSPKFRVYETDFGFGRPRKVEIASVHRKAISLVESSRGFGGIEVGLVLKKYEMDRFASLLMDPSLNPLVLE